MKKNLQKVGQSLKCCIDYCSVTYPVAETVLVNNYKCDQQTFSSSAMWRLRKNARQYVIGSKIIA